MEENKNELAEARAAFKAATGKNPSPRLDAAGVNAKLAEIQANPPADAGEAPAKAAKKAPAAKKAAAPKPAAKASTDELKAAGAAYVAHPEGIGCSLGGVSLEPDGKGRVLVPLSAVEELQSHGFQAA